MKKCSLSKYLNKRVVFLKISIDKANKNFVHWTKIHNGVCDMWHKKIYSILEVTFSYGANKETRKVTKEGWEQKTEAMGEGKPHPRLL